MGWIHHGRRKIQSIALFIDGSLLEPILLGSALVWTLPKLQDLFNHYTHDNIVSVAIWKGLIMDITHQPWVYGPFLFFFVWWLVSKIWHWKADERRVDNNTRIMLLIARKLGVTDKELDADVGSKPISSYRKGRQAQKAS